MSRGLTEPQISSILGDDPRRFFAGEEMPLRNEG